MNAGEERFELEYGHFRSRSEAFKKGFVTGLNRMNEKIEIRNPYAETSVESDAFRCGLAEAYEIYTAGSIHFIGRRPGDIFPPFTYEFRCTCVPAGGSIYIVLEYANENEARWEAADICTARCAPI